MKKKKKNFIFKHLINFLILAPTFLIFLYFLASYIYFSDKDKYLRKISIVSEIMAEYII